MPDSSNQPNSFTSFLRLVLPILVIILLVTWGVYVTFSFLGTDGHIIVLLQDAVWKKISGEVTGDFSRGFHALTPMISLLFHRLALFKWYGILSVIAIGILIFNTIFIRGALLYRIRLSGLKVLLLFIGVTWVLFTTLYFVPNGNIPTQYILEPKEEVYTNASDEALLVLQENVNNLEKAGCLTLLLDRRGPADAKVYQYRFHCLQGSFFTRVLSQLGMLLFLVLDMLVLGSMFLWLIRLKPSNRAIEFGISLALGAALFAGVLWVLALGHILLQWVTWVVLLLILGVGYRFTWKWIKALWEWKWDFRDNILSVRLILFYLLISYLAFNFLTVIRPFPIGWDDLGVYINYPRQLSSFGFIIPAIPRIQWEYITSLGFVLFGYFSVFGATLAQQINWLGGVMAIFAVYYTAKLVLGEKYGLLQRCFTTRCL